jgi:hypothetical protein
MWYHELLQTIEKKILHTLKKENHLCLQGTEILTQGKGLQLTLEKGIHLLEIIPLTRVTPTILTVKERLRKEKGAILREKATLLLELIPESTTALQGNEIAVITDHFHHLPHLVVSEMNMKEEHITMIAVTMIMKTRDDFLMPENFLLLLLHTTLMMIILQGSETFSS